MIRPALSGRLGRRGASGETDASSFQPHREKNVRRIPSGKKPFSSRDVKKAAVASLAAAISVVAIGVPGAGAATSDINACVAKDGTLRMLAAGQTTCTAKETL